VVGAPRHALAGLEGADRLLLVVPHGRRHVERWDQQQRALGVGEHGRMLGRQRVALGLRVVLDVAGRDLAVEPLAHVALGAARALGDFGGRQGPGAGQRVVEPEPVAQAGHDAAVAGGQVAEHLAQERLQLRFVDMDGHGSP
jgi:hypothetical protein